MRRKEIKKSVEKETGIKGRKGLNRRDRERKKIQKRRKKGKEEMR